MPTRALTVAAVERIKPPSQGQADWFDKGLPGLALRVSYGGAKTWVYFYRLHGRLRRLTLGRAPAMSLAEARDAWRDARKAVAKGENPARKTAPDSFAAVADEWLKRDQVHKRSAAEVKRVIERDVKPAWDGRLIATLSRRDVIDLVDSVVDRGAVTMARRLHAHLHRLFRWSVGRGILTVNPMTDLPKPGKAVKRDRVLVDAELAAVWKAADIVGWPFGPAVQLLILTAARRDEIGALSWSEVDGVTIELSGARTKNGEPHTIPLSTTAARLIELLPRIGGGDLVFTTNGETPVSGWSKAKSSLDDAAAKLYGRALPAWRLHDLRRTTATGMQRIGISLQVVEAILGHVGGSRAGVAGVYQRHTFDVEKRTALEAWAHEVERVVGGKSGDVIPMTRPPRS